MKIYSADGKTRVDEKDLVEFTNLQFIDVRKKPIIVHAVRIFESFSVQTLEGTMEGKTGDWLMRGINGELYPCAHDIFTKTYDIVQKTDEET